MFRGINFEIIHTIRHPLSSISSTVKNWLKYKRGIYLRPKELYYNLDVIVFGIQKLRKLNKKIHIIQLENMHRNVNSVMKHFCKIYSLKFQKCLVESTYHNLKWWGDKISGKDLNELTKILRLHMMRIYFKENDLAYFRYFTRNIKKYKYK